MKSMTGYGYASELNDAYQIEVEIKGYNNRYLDIVKNISHSLSSYEQVLEKEIKDRVPRGRVEVYIRLKELESSAEINVDFGILEKYKEAYSAIADKLDNSVVPTFRDFISSEGVIKSVNNNDTSMYEESLLGTFGIALNQFVESKKREGKETQKDLISLGSSFNESLNVINSNAERLESHIKSNIMDKYNELLDNKNLDENRFMTEVALLLSKYSINEEQQRLAAHIKEYNRLVNNDNEAVGKRLDFLCQEMNREINTIASKSQLVDINLEVVKMKDNLENIREQIRNIE